VLLEKRIVYDLKLKSAFVVKENGKRRETGAGTEALGVR
jgi:hypothetical protein